MGLVVGLLPSINSTRVGKGVQVVLVKERGVKKTSRGARINQRPNRYGGVVGKE